MLDTASKGRPPLEPIDPLIKAELGSDYGKHNGTTVLAGYLVGQVMYARNYERHGQATMKDRVAQTASLFRKRKSVA
jgi:hypothetical protein